MGIPTNIFGQYRFLIDESIYPTKIIHYSFFIIQYSFRKNKNAHPTGWTLYSVGISLFSRAVTSQVFSAPLSLTSVFGMGTGGPSASSTPTIFSFCRSLLRTLLLYYIILPLSTLFLEFFSIYFLS